MDILGYKLPRIRDRGIFYGSLAAFFCCLTVVLQEIPLIPVDQVGYAVSGRFFIMILFLVFGWLASCHPEQRAYGLLFAFTMYAWCFQGEYFRPNYAYAIIQFQVLHALFFRSRPRVFVILHVTMSTLFAFWMYLNWEKNKQRIIEATVIEDYWIILFISTTLAIIIYLNLNNRRKEKEEALSHFALVGKQTANLLHDFKNLAASPKIYSDALLSRPEKVDPETLELLKNLQHDLDRMNRLVKELHHSTKLPGANGQEDVPMLQACEHALEMMAMRTRGIEILIKGSSKTLVNGRSIQTILLNLIYNSVECFQRLATKPAKIEIEFGPRSLVYRDNGGGVPADLIRQFNSGGSDLGDGMGLFLIRDSAHAMNMEIKVSNTNGGACFEMRFLSPS